MRCRTQWGFSLKLGYSWRDERCIPNSGHGGKNLCVKLVLSWTMKPDWICLFFTTVLLHKLLQGFCILFPAGVSYGFSERLFLSQNVFKDKATIYRMINFGKKCQSKWLANQPVDKFGPFTLSLLLTILTWKMFKKAFVHLDIDNFIDKKRQLQEMALFPWICFLPTNTRQGPNKITINIWTNLFDCLLNRILIP